MAIWPLDTVRGYRGGLGPYRGLCRVDRPDCGNITPLGSAIDADALNGLAMAQVTRRRWVFFVSPR